MKSFSEIMQGIRRGLTRHCPECGKGKLFSGYLSVVDHCAVCGHETGRYPADDAPPYVTILLVRHLLVPTALIVDRTWPVAEWLQMTLWSVLAVLSTLAFLPFVKGLVVGFEWGMEIIREDVPEPLGIPSSNAVPKNRL